MKKIRIFFVLTFSAACVLLCSCGKKAGSSQQEISSVTIFGNSIVAHDPAPDIGWTGDWGMAASCRDSDFVHILKKEIGHLGPETQVAWGNLAAFEREWDTYDLSQLDKYGKSDLIIVKISENVQYQEGMETRFTTRYDELIRKLSGPQTAVIIAEGFWPTPVNDIIRRYASAHGYPFVALSDLFANDKTNAAIGLFENEGVANHPSDKGMRNIAARILETLKTYNFKQ